METESKLQLELNVDGTSALLDVHMSTSDIVDLISEEINRVMDLPEGALAGPVPDGEYLACICIQSLGRFGLLDGSHFAIVEECIKRLKN